MGRATAELARTGSGERSAGSGRDGRVRTAEQIAGFLQARLAERRGSVDRRERAEFDAQLGFLAEYRRAVARGRWLTALNLAEVLAVLAAAYADHPDHRSAWSAGDPPPQGRALGGRRPDGGLAGDAKPPGR
ncbi:DUF6221 family protein [Kineococcus glutinatus]|uniref:DUF6221 family protein n=1 Tax=Kineococcus glutinatus TaxID=1070872 RepID=UPI0031E8DD73